VPLLDPGLLPELVTLIGGAETNRDYQRDYADLSSH
jgi:hypothetical protein